MPMCVRELLHDLGGACGKWQKSRKVRGVMRGHERCWSSRTHGGSLG